MLTEITVRQKSRVANTNKQPLKSNFLVLHFQRKPPGTNGSMTDPFHLGQICDEKMGVIRLLTIRTDRNRKFHHGLTTSPSRPTLLCEEKALKLLLPKLQHKLQIKLLHQLTLCKVLLP